MTRSSGKRWLRTLALFLLLLAAARFTDCSPTLFWARRSHLTDLISAMLPPDWGYAPRILAPLLATVQMSVTGTALGSFLALLLAPLCAENLHAPKPLRWTLRLLVQAPVMLVAALVLPDSISTSTVPPAASSMLKLPAVVVVMLFTRIVPSLTTTV